MVSSSWRMASRDAIERAVSEATAAGLEGRDIVRHIDQAYPFGGRENWPYQMWLEERNIALHALGLAALTKTNRRRLARAEGRSTELPEERIARGQTILPGVL